MCLVHKHINGSMTNRICKLDLDAMLGLPKAFEKFFEVSFSDLDCKFCAEPGMVKDMKPLKFAKILILHFDLFDLQGFNIGKNKEIPLRLDLQSMTQSNYEEKEIFNLFSIIDCEGETQGFSKYSAIVQRKDKDADKQVWVEFAKGKKRILDEDEIQRERNPKMLFYRKEDVR